MMQDRPANNTLTMRDRFAMAALTALGQSFCQEWRNPNDGQINTGKWFYLCADTSRSSSSKNPASFTGSGVFAMCGGWR